jgi:hypothetical protein
LNHSGGGRLQIGFLARSHGGGTGDLAFFFASKLLLLPLTKTPANNTKDRTITNDIDVIAVGFILFLTRYYWGSNNLGHALLITSNKKKRLSNIEHQQDQIII